MAQYQSFPDAAGDSRTLEKLKALKLPDLAGRSFLDVGCNEGFFCGFARFLGAQRSVGIDHSKLFIERARQRFPECEFHQQGWEQLPPGSFDVILLASALHYAEDQPALLHRLVEKLAPDGVLVLELGIVSSPDSAWVEVERGIDRRQFPTMPMLREVLADYAWKLMGRSVSQDGDPVARHVIHISRRRPVAYLLMQPPAFGKTSIASRLFAPVGIPVVSGDQQIALVVQGKRTVPDHLREAITRDYSPFRIDEVIQRIFDSDAGEALVRMWVEQVGEGDFALDAYVPAGRHALVEEVIAGLGYLPIQLRWDRVGPRLLPSETLDGRAEEFYMSMATPAPSGQNLGDSISEHGEVKGFVDDVLFEHSRVVIRGWVVDAIGGPVRFLSIRLGGELHSVTAFERQTRPDVQKHLGLPHSLFGYRVSLPVPAGAGGEKLLESLEVRAGDAEGRLGPPLPFAASR